jgi:hypothetical protein
LPGRGNARQRLPEKIIVSGADVTDPSMVAQKARNHWQVSQPGFSNHCLKTQSFRLLDVEPKHSSVQIKTPRRFATAGQGTGDEANA